MTAKLWLLGALIGVIGAICSLPACEKVKPPPAPLPRVTVAPPVQKDVVNYKDFTGNTKAVETVEIRARVQGFLQSIHFRPGEMVNNGDLLFVIDPKPFEAKVNQAKAELATARAQLKLAEATLMRKENAFKDKAVSEVEVLTARAEVDQARAAIEGAKAAVWTAEIDLSYTNIKSPISGQITRNLVDLGNLVGRNEATLLATVYMPKPVHAYFNLAEYDVLYTRQKQREEKAPKDAQGRYPVYLGMAIEKGYPHQGYADYLDPTVDPETGTIGARAVFANEEGMILPGVFARIRFPIEEVKGALLVSESTLGVDQGGRYLLVVDEENIVQLRRVELGLLHGGLREIRKGIQAGERVIVNGLQRARPGSKVAPLSVEEARAMNKEQEEAMKAAARAKARVKGKAPLPEKSKK